MLCWRDVDWPHPEQLVEEAAGRGEVSAQLAVSLAVCKDSAAPELARGKLASVEAFERAAGAIALAYAKPKGAADELHGLAEEAASDIERAFATAAEVLAGRSDRGDALHDALRDLGDWSLLRPFWRYHILAALRLAAGDPRRAKLWAEVSGDTEPRFDAVVAELAARAAE